MPIARAQTFITAHGSNPTFGSNVTAGNMVVVSLAGAISYSTVTVTDSLGNSYTRITTAVNGTSHVGLYYSILTTGGSCQIQPSSVATTQVTAVEYSGVGSNPGVTSGSATGNANPLQVALTSSSGDLAVANWCDENNNNYSSPTTGFSIIQHDSSTFSAQVDDVNTGAGTTNAGINLTAGSTSSILVAADFTPGAGTSTSTSSTSSSISTSSTSSSISTSSTSSSTSSSISTSSTSASTSQSTSTSISSTSTSTTQSATTSTSSTSSSTSSTSSSTSRSTSTSSTSASTSISISTSSTSSSISTSLSTSSTSQSTSSSISTSSTSSSISISSSTSSTSSSTSQTFSTSTSSTSNSTSSTTTLIHDTRKPRIFIEQNKLTTNSQAGLSMVKVDDPVALVDDPSASVGAPTTISTEIPTRIRINYPKG